MSTCEQDNERNSLLDELAMAEKLSKINNIIVVLKVADQVRVEVAKSAITAVVEKSREA